MSDVPEWAITTAMRITGQFLGSLKLDEIKLLRDDIAQALIKAYVRGTNDERKRPKRRQLQ